MASNLSAIGFDFSDGPAFQQAMLGLAAHGIERLDCAAGCYSIWRSRTGAEIWFHLGVFGHEDDARDIAGLTPWYEGESEIAVEITERLKRPDDNAFEGALEAVLLEGEGRATGGRLTFHAVDFAAHAGRTLPWRCTVRLVGFARYVRASVSPAAVGPGRDGMMVTGRVTAHRRLVNEATGAAFDWLLVDSGGAGLDIVAEPAGIEGEIAIGTTVEVGCVLFGRVLEAP